MRVDLLVKLCKIEAGLLYILVTSMQALRATGDQHSWVHDRRRSSVKALTAVSQAYHIPTWPQLL